MLGKRTQKIAKIDGVNVGRTESRRTSFVEAFNEEVFKDGGSVHSDLEEEDDGNENVDDEDDDASNGENGSLVNNNDKHATSEAARRRQEKWRAVLAFILLLTGVSVTGGMLLLLRNANQERVETNVSASKRHHQHPRRFALSASHKSIHSRFSTILLRYQ